ncbi:MAG TPA: type II toxin-antitoxin system Phd/YefM family antitoxin [Candidatus Competibacteraceae bacterium]|nr:type II toxin-antitoxin system Phd/YefM family antitoxin [Candidatus Competibacteraceae bacterium]HRZ06574.1 type II toxin-antitoxin system Phd/YefM family antitoxin [Candidatus Competibacteraceae bacterium]HSA47067.1 type II toxin-antitoxin system Phd/YefM family antitoxin [Candidatus Competibacteraceae bacterium]
MIRECSVAKARQSLSRLIENLELGERITLTRCGKVVAILMTPADYTWLTGEQHRSWWEVIEKFRQQNDGVDLDDQEIDSWRDRSPPREIVL